MSFQLGPDRNIVGGHHDCNSALIATGPREGPQPVIDGKGDKQADSQRQAPNH
jgi:hypothetical protein